MEILTILGSPHDPAVSTILAHQLVKGARAAANRVTIFDAGHHPLAPVMMDADNHLLPSDAATEKLLDQMVAADLIVFATPMFYYGMSSQMKAVIDHMGERDPQLHGEKQAILVASAPHNDFDPLKSEFKAIFDHLGWKFAGQVLAGKGTTPKHLKFYPDLAYELGQSLK